MYRLVDHPLTSVRAYEATKWFESDNAKRIGAYVEGGDIELLEELLFPVPYSIKRMVGKQYEETKSVFEEVGFRNIYVFEDDAKDRLKRAGAVKVVTINGQVQFY